MTIPVRIHVSGQLARLASGNDAKNLARHSEIEVGQLVAELGLEGAVSVEVSASDTRRPLRVEVSGISVPFPPDLLSRPSLERFGVAGAELGSDGGTIADACVAYHCGNAEPSPHLVGQVVVDMIANRASLLIDHEQTSSYAMAAGGSSTHRGSLGRVLASLLDLGVIPRPRKSVVEAVARNSGRVLDSVEDAFATLQADSVEIVVAPQYRVVLTGEDEAASRLVSETPMEPRATEMFELLEQRLLVEWGIVAPDVMWATDSDVPEGTIAVKVNDRRSRPFPGLQADERVVLGVAAAELANVASVRTVPNPANPWLELAIVNAGDEHLEDSFPTASSAGFAALVVYRELLSNAHRLIGTEQTLYMLRDLQSRSPELIQLVLRHYSLAEITDLLRALVRERIPPRLLPIVLEQLARLVGRQVAPASRLEFVRQGLSDYIDHRFGRGDQARTFFELPAEVERLVAGSGHDDLYGEHLRDRVWATLNQHSVPPLRAAVLVPNALREEVYRLLEPELPEVAVLRRSDFAGEVPESIGTIDLPKRMPANGRPR